MWFGPRSGVDKSHDKVRAIDVSAQNLTNTRWSSTLVAGSLWVRQPCGDDDEWANAIDTREQQRHLDDAIGNDSNGDFRCGSPTVKQQRQLGMGDMQESLRRLLHNNDGCRHVVKRQ